MTAFSNTTYDTYSYLDIPILYTYGLAVSGLFIPVWPRYDYVNSLSSFRTKYLMILIAPLGIVE